MLGWVVACEGRPAGSPDAQPFDAGDTGCASTLALYVDRDGDGYGADHAEPLSLCGEAAGFAPIAGDCDDADPNANPAAEESCGTDVDDDCDGEINEADASGCTDWYSDADGDGYGDEPTVCTCEGPPSGFVADDMDCDDTDPERALDCSTAFSATVTVATDRAMSHLTALGDISGDGLADLGVMHWWGSNELSWYSEPSGWSGDGTLAVSDADNGMWLSGVGDVTGDGQGDAAVSYHQSLRILAGPLTGAVDKGATPWAEWTCGEHCVPIPTARTDLDGDGGADLGIDAQCGHRECEDGGFIYLLRGIDAGSHTLEGADRVALPLELSELTLDVGGDSDGDGLGEVVLGMRQYGDSGEIRIFRDVEGVVAFDDADVTITAPDSQDIGQWVFMQDDYDGDGVADLAGSVQNDNDLALWSLAATPAPDVEDAFASFNDMNCCHAVPAGDLDADGFSDILFGSGYSGRVYVFLGPFLGHEYAGGAAWTSDLVEPHVEADAHVLAPGDMDGDGWGDVVLAFDKILSFYPGPF
jgi:hypothetical protein